MLLDTRALQKAASKCPFLIHPLLGCLSDMGVEGRNCQPDPSQRCSLELGVTGDGCQGLLTSHSQVLSLRGLLQAGQEKPEEHIHVSSISQALDPKQHSDHSQTATNESMNSVKAQSHHKQQVSGSSHRRERFSLGHLPPAGLPFQKGESQIERTTGWSTGHWKAL